MCLSSQLPFISFYICPLLGCSIAFFLRTKDIITVEEKKLCASKRPVNSIDENASVFCYSFSCAVIAFKILFVFEFIILFVMLEEKGEKIKPQTIAAKCIVEMAHRFLLKMLLDRY